MGEGVIQRQPGRSFQPCHSPLNTVYNNPPEGHQIQLQPLALYILMQAKEVPVWNEMGA